MSLHTITMEDHGRLPEYVPPAPEHLKGTQEYVERDTTDPLAWQDFAMCKGVGGPNSPFYPHGYENSKAREEREEIAKKICGRCAVQGACLEYALSRRETHGIWGGLTEKELIKIQGRYSRSTKQ